MDQSVEKEIVLPNVSVTVATVGWESANEERPPQNDAYMLCQRLSEDNPPLRIGNINAFEAFTRARSVGFLPPGCAIKIFANEKPFRVINCAIKKDYFESTTKISPEQWELHTKELVQIRNRRLEVLMQEMYAELERPDFVSELVVESVCNLMLVELARYAKELEVRSAENQNLPLLAPWQLNKIQERIRASLEYGYPTLAELADICCISQSHLMRTFKASTGWPIHKYISEERLNTAKTMLVESELSCKGVSDKLGFKSSAYFATTFRRMTGLTPSEYRKQAKSNLHS